jgi:hypothetical protein
MRYRVASMPGGMLFTLILLLAVPLSGMADGGTASRARGPLVISFEANKTDLSATHKSMIRDLFNGMNLDASGKIFVVGYSDTSGDKANNERISRLRAQAVQKEIVARIGSGQKAPEVLILGRGPSNPVADNRRKEGRAQNRRVEVYWGRAVDNVLAGKDEPVRLELQVVEPLVHEAMGLLRRRRLPEALRLLREAHRHGAEHYGGYHTAQGIAAYYAGIDVQTTQSHLLAALRLDPFDTHARDYLGRSKALENVLAGRVTPEMGRQADAPIPVMAAAQAHAYLRLFKMQPLSRHRLPSGPVEGWVCRDPRGELISYYFDHAQVHAWAFSGPTSSEPASMALSDVTRRSIPASGLPAAVGNSSDTQGKPQLPANRIWDINLFR